MAGVVEMRDAYTARHQQRVADLACAIAEELGFPKRKVKGIRMAAIVHDIGKISTPVEILNKPTRLTELEFSLIRKHAQIGSDILKAIKFPWPIAEIVLQHHERINSSGYPFGLSGEKIVPEARVLAVADVVEAMASHRPYRPALGIDRALDEISQQKGILYDADAVDACMKLFSEKRFSLE
jgi:putative nucleotidyltransferase with HDIG domain